MNQFAGSGSLVSCSPEDCPGDKICSCTAGAQKNADPNRSRHATRIAGPSEGRFLIAHYRRLQVTFLDLRKGEGMRILSLLWLLWFWSGTSAAAEPTLVEERFRVFFTHSILVPDVSGAGTMRSVVSLVANPKKSGVQIHKYAGRFGESGANELLSRDRAAIVKYALEKLGVAEPVIRDQDYGERDLLFATRDEVNQPSNIRVEIIVRGNLERSPVDDLLPLAFLEAEAPKGSPNRP